MKRLLQFIWPSIRFAITRTPEALVLRRAPERTIWTLAVIPILLSTIFFADFNMDGQGPAAQVFGKYVFPVLMLSAVAAGVLRHETVRVTTAAFEIESVMLGYRRRRSIPLAEVEHVQYDPGSAGDGGNSSGLRLKRSGRMRLILFAEGIQREQADEFLLAMHFVIPRD